MNKEQRTQQIAERKEATDRSERLWCKDEWRDSQVFRVPVDALLLNADNRRFSAERRLMEERLGHALDPENNPDDELSVIAILLDSQIDVVGGVVQGKPSKDYEALRDDWLRRRQEHPFWIRPDGTVHNGNRRLALVKRLRREGGADGADYVDAIILDPDDVREDDLFKMEQREQLTDDLKVKYTDINLLLALREAAMVEGIDWADPESIKAVAGLLYHIVGGDRAYAVIQLQAIRFMEAYLADMNAPGEYQRLLGTVERFRDIGKVMAQIEREYPDDAGAMLRILFAAVKSGNPHQDIRAVRQIFLKDRERYERLLADVDETEAGSEPVLEEPDLSDEESADNDDGDEDEGPGPRVSNYPTEKVRTVIKDAIDGLAATRVKDTHSLLVQVTNRLESIDADRITAVLSSAEADKVRPLLEAVLKWSEEHREAIRG